MKFVRVFMLGKDRADHEVGVIQSDGRDLSFTPHVPAIRTIIAEPVGYLDKGKMREVTPDDPDAFLEALHRQYCGSYLRVGKPETGEGGDVSRLLRKDFDESQHPRGEHGRFGAGGAGGPISPTAAMVALSSEHGTEALVNWEVKSLGDELKHVESNPEIKHRLNFYGQLDNHLKVGPWGEIQAGEDTRAVAKAVIARDVGALMKGKCTELEAASLADALKMPPTYQGQTNWERAANGMVDLWHHTSGDHDQRALGVQIRAAQMFQTADPWLPKLPDVNANDSATFESHPDTRDVAFASDHKNAIDAFLKSTYDNTQTKLAAAGIDKITIYRGMQLDSQHPEDGTVMKAMSEGGRVARLGPLDKSRDVKIADDVQLRQMPLSSYSTDIHTSWRFGRPAYEDQPDICGMMIGTVIPREKIFSTATTGPGCLSENEILAIHSDNFHAKAVMFPGGSSRLDPWDAADVLGKGTPMDWAGSKFWKEA